MLEKIKANLAPFILGCVVTVFGLVAMISYFITNGLPGYGIGSGFATVLAIFSFVLPLAYTLCLITIGDKCCIATILGLLTIVFEILLVGYLIDGRILTIAAVASYDSGNQVAWSAVYSAVVSIVCLLVSAIVMVVAGFKDSKKEAE